MDVLAPTVNAGKSNDISVGFSPGFNDGIYGWSGGLSFSENSSHTNETLVDINGDGLPDLVSPGSGEFSVRFNTGAGFADPVSWKDAVGHGITKSSATSQGGGVYITISVPILVIPVPPTIIWLNINPGINPKFANNSMSRQETAIMDMNGDGYPDHIYSSSDGSMTVGENPTGRTNLLKTVSRPLGGKFDLEYVRRGNTYDRSRFRFSLRAKTVLRRMHPEKPLWKNESTSWSRRSGKPISKMSF